ncbi:MAG: twin-arginine translocation signal domain-containing protein, partial [Anaerolinea sp.]|nr:twin-arginine translocation signal domain-containing protein [Anaerolinea sp.]
MTSKPFSRRAFLRISGAAGAAAALAACASPAQPTTAPAANEKPAAETPAAEAPAPAAEAKLSTQLPYPVKFSYLRPVWGPATHQKGAAYELELFKRANVEIESQIVPVFDYETKFPVLV